MIVGIIYLVMIFMIIRILCVVEKKIDGFFVYIKFEEIDNLNL